MAIEGCANWFVHVLGSCLHVRSERRFLFYEVAAHSRLGGNRPRSPLISAYRLERGFLGLMRDAW